jgi:hypothetical protein
MIVGIILLILIILSIIGHILQRADQRKYVERLAIRAQKEEKYFNEVEPSFREARDYPQDWERRRALVFIRSNGRCSECDTAFGANLKCNAELIWDYPYDYRLVFGMHVHHKRAIGEGGNHSLENLVPLCSSCHSKRHPRNQHLADMVLQPRARMIRFGYKDGMHRAGILCYCRVCQRPIYPGQHYYGNKGQRKRVCMDCREKFFRTR